VESDRLKASGYADTKPVLPHVDEFGRDIVENRAANRRIVIRIYY
jgi:chemotaxis protein MotB